MVVGRDHEFGGAADGAAYAFDELAVWVQACGGGHCAVGVEQDAIQRAGGGEFGADAVDVVGEGIVGGGAGGAAFGVEDGDDLCPLGLQHLDEAAHHRVGAA